MSKGGGGSGGAAGVGGVGGRSASPGTSKAAGGGDGGGGTSGSNWARVDPSTASESTVRSFAAAAIDKAAAAPESQRWGFASKTIGGKVWLSAARPDGMSKPAFDAMILRAHRMGLVELSRSDTAHEVGGNSGRDAASEVRHPAGAVFHFIRVPRFDR